MRDNQNKELKNQDLQKVRSLIFHYRTINFFLICILFFNGAQIYNNLVAYSIQQSNSTETKETEPLDIIKFIFQNSVTTMLLSTFIIGIVGVLINKLRVFKKKLDMIEILTKSQVKMKQQAEVREKRFETMFLDSQKLVGERIDKLCDKMDKKTEQLETKIDNVENNATKTLIKYLSEDRR